MSTLKVSKREVNKNVRELGDVPGVVYGKDKPNTHIAVDALDLKKTIRETGRNGLFELQIENENTEKVMLQDIQTDPLKGDIVHADFYIVDLNKEVEAHANVHLINEAQGVKDGGILQQPLHQVTIAALPTEIPSTIEVDISDMEVGDKLQISDLQQMYDSYDFKEDEDTVVASILPPITEEVYDAGEVQTSNAEDHEGIQITE